MRIFLILFFIIPSLSMAELSSSSEEEDFFGITEPSKNPISERDLSGPDIATRCEVSQKIYKSVIGNSKDVKEVQEAYYLLAKSYSMCGNSEASLGSMISLVELSVGGPLEYESAYRVAESAFRAERYEEALSYYEIALAGESGPPNKTQEYSKYMAAWSLLKLKRFPESAARFSGMLGVSDERFNSPNQANTVKSNSTTGFYLSVIGACGNGAEAGRLSANYITAGLAKNLQVIGRPEFIRQCSTDIHQGQCECAYSVMSENAYAQEPNPSLKADGTDVPPP